MKSLSEDEEPAAKRSITSEQQQGPTLYKMLWAG